MFSCFIAEGCACSVGLLLKVMFGCVLCSVDLLLKGVCICPCSVGLLLKVACVCVCMYVGLCSSLLQKDVCVSRSVGVLWIYC